MKKSLLMLLVFTVCGLLSFGQNVTIKGQVTTSDQLGLPGVTVVEKGTANGTVTNVEGNYEVTVSSSDAVLIFSFIGFTTQEFPVAGKTSIDVVMQEDTHDIDEVMVVGFGTQKKANITGAAAAVEMEDVLGNRPVTNAAVAIQGSVAGLQVVSTSGQPGSEGVSLNVRGAGSLNGSSNPLVLMDNVPVSMADVNPQDIETVTVLKDAAASSIYGARAAFGVILITTKKGAKEQPVKFQYSNTFSVRKAEDVLEKASTYDFVHALQDWGLDAFWTGPDVDTWVDLLEDHRENPENYPDGYAMVDGLRYPLTDTDLIGAFMNEDGFTQIHNFSFSGGSKKTAYRVSAGFSDEDGIIVTDSDQFKKYNVTSYLKTDVTDRLSLTADIKYNRNYRRTPISSYSKAVSYNPFAPEDGNHVFDDGSEYPYDSPANLQSLYVIPERWQDKIRLFTALNYELAKDLTFTGEYTFQKTNTDFVRGNNQAQTVNSERFTLNASDPANTYHERENQRTVYQGINLYFTYLKSFGEHNLKVLLGSNREEQGYEMFRARRYNLVDVNLPALGTATGIIEANDAFYEWAVMGYFGRVNYNWREKYFLEVNARYDGSSRFADGDRWGLYPSLSAGWNMTRENFMEGVDWVNQVKWRASWGEVGNQVTYDIDNKSRQVYYPYVPGMPLYEADWLNEDALQQYASLESPLLVSSGFTWERVRTLNFGVDTRWLNNRLSSSIDVYRRETIGMLDSGYDLPTVLGTEAPRQNSTDMLTKGWEFEVTWNDRIGDFSYSIGGTLWDNQSELTKVGNESGLIANNYVGKQIGEIWGYVTEGYYTEDDFVDGSLDENLMNGTLKEGIPVPKGTKVNPGDVRYADLNGDGEIFNGDNTIEPLIDPETGEVVPHTGPGDRKIIGNNRKRYQYGLFLNADYKGWDFSIMLNGIGKRDIYINNATRFPYINEFNVMYTGQLDYWTPDNTNAYFPRNYALGGVNYGYNRRTQTKYLLDGSYMRIKNITFGYSFSKGLLEKAKIDKLRIYIAGENVADFNNWPDGINTELANKGGGATYPYMKGYSIGLNLTF